MTPAPQTEDLIAQLEKALQLWAEAESAKSNKLWQTEEDALRTLQVAMYDFWKPANLRTLLDSYRTAERALICAPAECGPGCEDHECPYTHSPLTWEQHAKNMETDYVTAKARAEAAETDLAEAKKSCKQWIDLCAGLRASFEAAAREVERLREALAPYANLLPDEIPPVEWGHSARFALEAPHE